MVYRVGATLVWLGILFPLVVNAEPTASLGDKLESGRKIYNFRCYFCHGYSGDARTLAASFMAVQPRNFSASDPQKFPLEQMEKSIAQGRPGTAMPGFDTILTPEEIQQVALFIRDEFMTKQAPNTRYHTPENGWPDHNRYQAAFPFITGAIPLDAGEETLTPENKTGKQLFMSACITCHDHATIKDAGPIWEPYAVSWPRNQFSHRDPPLDAVARATPYAQHDIPPVLSNLTPEEKQGETLFQKNCAFCHGADGTGLNYIGTFLNPHPRNLTTPGLLTAINLEAVIRDGVPNTSMPAWGQVLSATEITTIALYARRAFGSTP
ncbi:MAG: c-type cytochrome [Magnetococcales bacterium]|nr:c-type cytochrome [Magnetococcales bacterium]